MKSYIYTQKIVYTNYIRYKICLLIACRFEATNGRCHAEAYHCGSSHWLLWRNLEPDHVRCFLVLDDR